MATEQCENVSMKKNVHNLLFVNDWAAGLVLHGELLWRKHTPASTPSPGAPAAKAHYASAAN